MQPFKFRPILKQTIWGGQKIKSLKHIDTTLKKVGESWEISGVPGNETQVAGGPFDGKPLNELVATLKEELIGKANYERFGNEFPLLIKFIDATDDLSIQVHPTDETAKKQGRHRGKTEMWYLMDSDAGASLLCGLKRTITPQEYKALVESHHITDVICRYQVKEGDCFFLPAGRIHAIGSGCMLAEIQQTSDVTYRIYDFNRHDDLGRPRELHTELAAESIDYHVEDDYQTHYTPMRNERTELVRCPHFTTSIYDLDFPLTLNYSSLDSFVILIALKGHATLTDNEGNTISLRMGETVLIPATTKTIRVEGEIKFLETYV